MLITLYGPDSYRRKQKLNELLSLYKSKHQNIDLVFFDIEEDLDSWKEASDFLKQPSMFVESKLAVINGATWIDKKAWLDILKSYEKDRRVFVLILEDKKPGKKFNFLLKKGNKSQEFKELEGNKLKRFLFKKLKDLNIKLSLKAESFFVSYLLSQKNRSWLLVNQLGKISLAGFGDVVKEGDFKKIIQWRSVKDMPLVTNVILNSNDIKTKLVSLEKLFLRKEDPVHLFNLLAYQSRGFKAAELAELDVSIKSGKLEYQEAILDLALN